ncbi:MAG: energy-coupling factor transporter transmembrane protein EcfT, partial [Desulfurococcaceae archaeon]
TILLNPVHFSSVVGALITINYERAKWSGISAEIRGLRKIKPTRNFRAGLSDIFMLMILLSQIVLIIAT